MDLKKGDIIFVYGSSLIDKAIEFITRSKYNHIAIYIGEGKVMEAQGFRTVGTQDINLYNGVYDAYRIPLTNEQIEQGLNWLIKQEGREYDYWDIFVLLLRCTIKFRIPWHEGKRILCSRLGRDFVSNCNIKIPNKNMTPEDFFEWVINNFGYKVN